MKKEIKYTHTYTHTHTQSCTSYSKWHTRQANR